MIERRLSGGGMGFNREVKETLEDSHLFKEVQPEDLQKYGFIPELIGRMPIIAPLDELTEDAMLSILIDPKNALVKQYKKLFELEDVHLEFTPQALDEIVKLAKKRKTGARALRSIIEESMLEIMYEFPSMDNVDTCIITDEVIKKIAKPVYKTLKKQTA